MLFHIADIVVEQLLFELIGTGIVHIRQNDALRQVGTGLDQILIEPSLEVYLTVDVDPVRCADLLQLIQFLLFEVPDVLCHDVQCFLISIGIFVSAQHPQDILFDQEAFPQCFGDFLTKKVIHHLAGTGKITISLQLLNVLRKRYGHIR